MCAEVSNKKEYFYNVDFLRFILAVEIILFHFGLMFKNCNPFFQNIFNHFKHGFICVEFFFIISGFFLFKNINITENTITFAQKRLIRLLPVKYFTLGALGISSLFIKGISISFNKILISLLLLNCIGFNSQKTGPVEIWYISVLFWISLFYFYIHKIFNKKCVNLIMWLATFFSCAFVLNCNSSGHAGIYKNHYIIFNEGIMRGIFCIGLGYFIVMLYNSNFLKSLKNLFHKILVTIIEIFAYAFLIYYLTISSNVPGNNYLNYILIFIILFYLLITKQGYISKLINNKILARLGQYSYSMYVIHWPVFIVLKKTIFKTQYFTNNPNIFFLLTIITAIFAGILTYYLVEKPSAKYLKNKLIQNTTNN